jgi:glycosyltransferase involved in cell wall biosynthesis
MCRVSVLLPVYNAEPYLWAALRSLERQTLADFEVIAVDDGSEDASLERLERAAERDARIKVLRPGRIGLVPALNLAREAARAPYLARFDADDAMHPRRLELQAAHLDAHPEIDILGSRVRHFPTPTVLQGNRIYEDWLNSLLTHEEILRDRFVESPVPHPSVMMRASAFDRVGGYRDMGWAEDYDFWLRAAECGLRFEKVPETLLFWRDHPARLTRTDSRTSLQSFLRAKAEFLVRGPLAAPGPFVVWGAGMVGRRLTRLLIQAGRPPIAILDIDPRVIGRTRHGRPIIPVEAFRPKSAVVLGAVGARGARAQIRERLLGWGLQETHDFWMVT